MDSSSIKGQLTPVTGMDIFFYWCDHRINLVTCSWDDLYRTFGKQVLNQAIICS